MTMPVQDLQRSAPPTDAAIREALSDRIRENAVYFRGLTSDGFLYFERKDHSRPLSQAEARNLTKLILGNIRSIKDASNFDFAAFLKTIKGVRIA